MIDNQIVWRIAQKIRSTRLEKNLTIQKLADRTHISKGLLSKIENSRTLPFITCIRDADPIPRISLKDFFRDMALVNGKNYLLVKRDHYAPLEREPSAGLANQFVLSQNITNCTMQIVLLTIESGSRGRSTTSSGYKFNFLISGSCEYTGENDTLVLEEGDSLYFDASLPHMASNVSRRKVTVLSVHFILQEK